MPVSSLSPRSILNIPSLKIEGGIGPVKEFDEKIAFSRFVKLPNISGIVPVNELPDSPNEEIEYKCFTSSGNVPAKLLLLIHSSVKDLECHRSEGTSPPKLLSFKRTENGRITHIMRCIGTHFVILKVNFRPESTYEM